MKRFYAFFGVFIILLSSLVMYPLDEPNVVAEVVPEYEDASEGLPTTSLWVAKPEFFDLNNDGSGDLTILGPRKGPGSHSLHTFSWDGSSWTDISTQEGTDNVPHWSYGGHEFGDLDNDGDWDVGAGSHGAERVDAYLRSFGTLWLQASNGLGNSEDAWNVDVGDYNNDGNLDLLVGGFWGHDLRAYAGDGNGNWIDQSDGFESSAASHAEGYFCDVNNDGNLDAIANLRGGSWCYLGDGNGGWTNSSEGLPGGFGIAPAFGDFNDDGNIDIAFSSNGEVYAFEGDGTGQWSDRSNGLPDDRYSSIRMADMNNDRYDDLVCMYPSDPGIVEIYLSDGTGNWSLIEGTSMEGNAQGRRVSAGDYDHNGFRDVVAGFATEEEFGSIRVWKETTVPSEMGAMLDYPDGGEYLRSSSVRFIRWRTAVPTGSGARTVKLELSTEGTNGPWDLIEDNLPDSGIYQWNVPDIDGSGDCYIKITVEDGQGTEITETSDRAFGINRAPNTNQDPTMVVLKPSSKQEPADASYSIEWSADDEDGDSINITLYFDEDTDPGNGMTLIAGDLQNTGDYEWDCSSVANGEYHIYGLAEDGRGGSAHNYSLGTVLIEHEVLNNDPTMEITRPASQGEKANDSYTIEWSAEDDDPDTITIDLYYDDDDDPDDGKILIEAGIGNSGSYLWNTSEIDEGEYFIHGIADDNNGSRIGDHSDETLTVSHPDPPPPPDENEEPTIEVAIEIIDELTGTITWDATDPDEDELSIDLYWDTDTDAENGKTAIDEELEDSGEFQWDISGIDEGEYYIYAFVQDGNDGQGEDYSNAFTINRPDDITPVADFEITFFQAASASDKPGENVFIQVKVENIGDGPGTGSIVFSINNETILSEELQLDAGEEKTRHSIWTTVEGDHTISVEAMLVDDPTPDNNMDSRMLFISSGGNDNTDDDDDDVTTYLIAGGVLLLVIVVVVVLFGSSSSRKGDNTSRSCPKCGGATEHSHEEDDDYCWNCEEYVGEMPRR